MKQTLGLFILISVFTLFISTGLYAQQDSLNFPAPQYMLPFYDHFSLNHLNVSAMGRGQTTNAIYGKVDNAVNNPATLYSEKAYLYMELTIKPPLNEIDEVGDQQMSSPIPFGMIGISGKIYNSIHGAISYNVPKSIVYDSYMITINQGGDLIQRYPTYYEHQITASIAGNIGKIRLGLNIQQQFRQFEDITVFQSFDRIDKTFYTIRFQPGIFYQSGQFSAGATITPPTQTRMDIKYTEYDVTLPMQITAGGSFAFTNNCLYAETEWEQFSEMSTAFDDRLTLKAGYEKYIRDITYRVGLLSMPGVYSGAFRLPVNESENPEVTQWWDVVPRGGYIDKTDQLYATCGFTYSFKGGELTLGVMRDLLGNVPATQFATSIGFDLETLKGKKFLIIDK